MDIKCRKCGAPLENDLKRCPYCGTIQSKMIVFATAISVLLLTILLTIGLTFANNNSDSQEVAQNITQTESIEGVKYLTNYSVQSSDDSITLLFGLQDGNKNYIKSAADVFITITNKNGTVVWEGTENINAAEDFGYWPDKNNGQSLLASIKVSKDNITSGDVSEGKIKLKVKGSGFNFSSAYIKIDDLPVVDVVASSQTEPATETDEPTEKQTTAASGGLSTGKRNALRSAKSYLNSLAFSYQGLIKQLEYEKYTHEEAVYAADNCGADWNAQAVKSAKSYLRSSSFSHQGLIEQLEYENFTYEQAAYGADNCGADWNEQAKKCAAAYLRVSSFSRQELIGQLEYEGFTNEQAVYGVQANGY